jgi:uncharacterized SAM-binding protein YcdF (DUF218 family)
VGPPADDGPSEPAVRADLARGLGVPPEALLVLDGARTTRDEGVLVAAALRPRGVRRILLVSAAEHLPRAGGVFERQGLAVLPAPVHEVWPQSRRPSHRLDLARRLAQEAAGRVVYRLAGHL